jgi:hypothetical protein
MIGQYLPNNNEKSYSAVLQKNLYLNAALFIIITYMSCHWIAVILKSIGSSGGARISNLGIPISTSQKKFESID